ncbi:hypothetical protein GGR57DRAFT_515432 [Xylariaceae sp. FL1272]|nr:hypothetical protein GGR57DRAFT_515432 [Xylariaceae sp. FL1272]
MASQNLHSLALELEQDAPIISESARILRLTTAMSPLTDPTLEAALKRYVDYLIFAQSPPLCAPLLLRFTDDNGGQQAIILSLPDTFPIRALALSGPVLYKFIKNNEPGLAPRLTFAKIPADLLQLTHLIFKLRSAVREPLGDPETPSFDAVTTAWTLTNEVLGPEGAINSWKNDTWTSYRFIRTFHLAEQYLDFHRIMMYYAQQICFLALEQAPGRIRNDRGKYVDKTDSELHRFMKALYLFEAQMCGCWFNMGAEFDPHNRSFDVRAAFWLRFPPWEERHVYVVKRLLIAYFQDVLDLYKYHPEPHRYRIPRCHSDTTAMLQLIGRNSLHGLYLLELGREDGIYHDLGHPPPYVHFLAVISEGWFEISHLRRSDTSNRLRSLDGRDIFQRFSKDPSAAASWYHTLVTPHLSRALPLDRECLACMDKWAWCLWDRKRLNRWRRQPSLKKLLFTAADTWTTYSHLREQSRQRRDPACKCFPFDDSSQSEDVSGEDSGEEERQIGEPSDDAAQ